MPGLQSAATRVARAAKARDPIAEAAARRDLAEVKITTYVDNVLAQSPPLTDEQRVRLARLFHPMRGNGGA